MNNKIERIFTLFKKCFRYMVNRQAERESKTVTIINGVNNSISVDKTVVLKNCTFNIMGDNNSIIIKDSSTFLRVTFYVRGNNNRITIDQFVRFNRGGSIWIEDGECEVFIDEKSSFEDVHIAVTEPGSKIHIGKECMFAYDVDVRTGDSHSIIDTITNRRINYAQSISIGNHVWVASHVSILKGVHIGDNSIVATRAVVTKSFNETNILIGGIPAKKIKENVNWNRQRIYQ